MGPLVPDVVGNELNFIVTLIRLDFQHQKS